jgi:hypothetical protein
MGSPMKDWRLALRILRYEDDVENEPEEAPPQSRTRPMLGCSTLEAAAQNSSTRTAVARALDFKGQQKIRLENRRAAVLIRY